MVQHTLLVKNVANTLLRVELAKLLGEQHKIVDVSFKKGKKGDIKYAKVVVESKANIATVTGLIDKKTVNGKELQVTAGKAPHERGSYVARLAELKRLEKFPSIWPAPTYRNVAKSNPLKNGSFPPAYVHGEKLSLQPSKTIKKRVPAPSNALYLSKIPAGVTKKQILEAFKSAKVRRSIKRSNHGFVIFKDEEARKKAQALAKDNKITIGDKTINVAEATKFANKTVEVPREVKPAPAVEKKPLSVNGRAKKLFAAYRKSVHNQKQRLVRKAAVKKLKEFQAAVAAGKAQARVVRKVKPKKAIAKPNPAVEKKLAAKKAKALKAKSGAAKKTS